MMVVIDMCYAPNLTVTFFIVTCLGLSVVCATTSPTTVEPISYTLNITALYNRTNDRAYQGHVTIKANAVIESQEINLHVSGLDILDVTVRGDPYSVSVLGFTTYQNNDTLLIRTSRFRVGDPLTILVQFRGNISDTLKGFYRSTYIPFQSWVDATQFQPIEARKAFPCFDLPKFRSHFALNFVINQTMDVVSNMPVLSSEMGQLPGTKIIRFQQTPRMPTYLLAWIIYDPSTFGRLYSSSLNDTSLKISIWGRLALRNQSISQIIAQQYAPKVLSALEQFTGFSYTQTMPKLDMAALPNFDAAAMENWGLVTFRESRLMYDSASTSQDLLSLMLTVSHELSHQWFGNLVSVYSWAYTWLNEGFATYFEYTNLGYDELLVVNAIQLIMRQDSSGALPLTKEDVETSEEISDIFGRISYSKGAAILRMVKSFVGEENFQNGIRVYLRNAMTSSIVPNSTDSNVPFANVTYPSLLWDALNGMNSSMSPPIPARLSDIMKAWTDTPSYPLVRIIRNGTTNFDYFISQELQTSNASIRTPSSWWIPVTSLDRTLNRTNLTWVKEGGLWHAPALAGSWYYVNVNATGYYRVLYDDENWVKLSEALKENPCPLWPLARSQILTDALSLLMSGHLNPNIALSVVEFLKTEDSDIVWTSAFNSLMVISNDLIDSVNWDTWQTYVMGLMANVSKMNNVEHAMNNGLQSGEIRKGIHATNIVKNACYYGNSTCIQWANDLKKNYDGYSRNLQSALLCFTMKNITMNEWLSMYSRYESATYPAEKQTILQNLACVEDRNILTSFLNIIVYSSQIPSDNFIIVINSICSTSNGARATFAFLKDNYNMILQNLQFNGKDAAVIMNSILQKLTTHEEINEVEQFLSRTTDMGIKLEKRTRMLADARNNIARRKETERRICTVLNCVAQGGSGSIAAPGLWSPVLMIITFIIVLLN